jgi:WD40 repeat protein
MQGNGRYIGASGNSVVSLYNRAGTLIGRNTTLPATSLAVSPNGSMMVVGTPTGILGLNRKGDEKWSYEAFENRRVLFFPDGNLVAAASSYSVLVFDPGGTLFWNYRTGNTLADIAVSSNNAYITAGGHDKKVYLLDRGGRLIWSREVGDPVGCVAISGDGSFIAAGSVSGNDKRLYLFNKSGDLAGTYQMEAWVMGVSLSSDGSYLAAVSNDGNLYYFRTTPPASIPITTTLITPVMTTTATQVATTPAEPPTPYLPAITPNPAIGIVSVDSIPGGAEVYVDHRYIGTTPLTLGGLAAGTHRIVLIWAGYEDWTSDFELSDENVTVSAVLIPYSIKTETRLQMFTVIFAFCIAVLIFSRWWNSSR